MTWSAWMNLFTGYLHIEGKRRGVETLRSLYLKSALLDLKRFVTRFDDGKTSYLDTDPVPFTELAAEAAAAFVKAKLVRHVEKDLALERAHFADYLTLRRTLFLWDKEAPVERVPLEVWAELVAAVDLASSSFVSVTADGLRPADAANNLPAHGFVRPATVAGAKVLVDDTGDLNGLSGLVRGITYFLSATTPGTITATPPNNGLVQRLGIATAPDVLLVEIEQPIVAL